MTRGTILAASNKGVYKTFDGGDTWVKKIEGDFFDIEVKAFQFFNLVCLEGRNRGLQVDRFR